MRQPPFDCDTTTLIRFDLVHVVVEVDNDDGLDPLLEPGLDAADACRGLVDSSILACLGIIPCTVGQASHEVKVRMLLDDDGKTEERPAFSSVLAVR